ncbi:MAG: META domain-containing protein [Anaerolineales bacterium]|nr:META domain-containing protein [Anaerolineales bacterium]
MKKITQFLLVIFAISSFILTACSGNDNNATQSPTGNTSASPTGTWELNSYGSPTSLVAAAVDVETSIDFAADGTLAGNVGCNGFGGDYTVDGDKIVFGQIISTLMFCEGPVGEQEAITLAVFAESAPFTIDGDTMTITSADGSSVVVLARK